MEEAFATRWINGKGYLHLDTTAQLVLPILCLPFFSKQFRHLADYLQN